MTFYINFYISSINLQLYIGELLRYALLTSHYRSTLNWTKKLLNQSKQDLDKFYGTLRNSNDILNIETEIDDNPVALALFDDINTPKAISVMHQLSTDLNKKHGNLETIKAQFLQGAKLLGILTKDTDDYFKSGNGITEKDILSLIDERSIAKKDKDFIKSDEIRNNLLNKGIEIKDTRDGTIWQRIRK